MAQIAGFLTSEEASNMTGELINLSALVDRLTIST
jgi:hypothetical protein